MFDSNTTFDATEFQPLAAPSQSDATALDYRLLVMVDIDGMAALNQDLGWQHGDAAIAAVRSVLRSTTPGGDVWQAWRAGKFVATLWGSVDTATWLISLPDRVLRRTKIPVTVCGVAMRSPTPADLPMLAEHMAEGKRTGRGRAYLFDARSN